MVFVNESGIILSFLEKICLGMFVVYFEYKSEFGYDVIIVYYVFLCYKCGKNWSMLKF